MTLLNGRHPERRAPDEITASTNTLPAHVATPTFSPCERCGERCRVMPGKLHNRCVICAEILRRQAEPKRDPWMWFLAIGLFAVLVAVSVVTIVKILGSMP